MQHLQVNLNKSAEYLRLALPLMARYGIPVTPVNYAVLYEYVSGNNQQLNRKFDELLLNNKQLENRHIKTLFDEFIDLKHEFSRLEDAHSRFSTLHLNFTQALEEACENTNSFSQSLDSCKQQMEEDSTPQFVESLLRDLSNSTQTILRKNKDLLTELNIARIEINELKKQLIDAKRQTVTDTMTNLPNRKAFFDHMGIFMEMNKNQFTKSALVMLDIDHFKNINDSFGHLFGDKVIKTVAEVLRRLTKGKDMPARFGGEEFIIHLPDTDINGAKAVAEAIRRTIENASIINPLNNKVISKVTVSLGLTEILVNGEIDEAIARADKALYQAKNTGRNRVCIAETCTTTLYEEMQASGPAA
ncbi:MAG TPA: GGDEF domain-containing protein [Candidatus Acidoferrum sp.]|nr:GGDEF domain-containing protein [Candidatus Acidoferrum sp.]